MPESTDFSVLLVESDTDFIPFFRKSLELDSQFPSQVDAASDFREALEKLRKNSYDLVLVESDVHGHPGLKLIEELNRQHINLPFVLLTPIHDDNLIREALKQGVADVIVKSQSQFHELAEKLRRSYQKFHGQPFERINSQASTLDEITAKPFRSFEVPLAPKFNIQDELTGLYNHSYLQDRIVKEFSRAARYKFPISSIFLDIDHFKMINEKNGYRIGDAVLKESAGMLFDHCRMSDLIARYGGEEFAIVLPHIDYKGALDLAKRLRLVFSEHIFLRDTENIQLTVSIGVCSFPEDQMGKRSDLITLARKALLRSKASGRNQITLFRNLTPVADPELPHLKISEEKVEEFQRRLSDISEATRRVYIEASRALIFALESKDTFTVGHSARSEKYAMQVAQAMGMSLEEAEVVEHAALLHDIGKTCIPDNILLKPGKLTMAEYESMKQHPYLGFKILKPIKFLHEEAILVLHHHEWFNGEGYPSRLKGEEIPLGARIISVIDSYDTMRVAGGRYKKTMTVEDAVNELIAFSGTQFDARVVQAFIEVLKERKELISNNYNQSKLDELLRSLPATK